MDNRKENVSSLWNTLMLHNQCSLSEIWSEFIVWSLLQYHIAAEYTCGWIPKSWRKRRRPLIWLHSVTSTTWRVTTGSSSADVSREPRLFISPQQSLSTGVFLHLFPLLTMSELNSKRENSEFFYIWRSVQSLDHSSVFLHQHTGICFIWHPAYLFLFFHKMFYRLKLLSEAKFWECSVILTWEEEHYMTWFIFSSVFCKTQKTIKCFDFWWEKRNMEILFPVQLIFLRNVWHTLTTVLWTHQLILTVYSPAACQNTWIRFSCFWENKTCPCVRR